MKGYTIIWNDGFKARVHINNEYGVEELESKGFYFDDFVDDGTGDEIWER